MRRLYRILFAAACVACAASLAILFGYYRMNREGSREYRGLMAKAVAIRAEAGNSDSQVNQNTALSQQAGVLKDPPALLIDFDRLREANPDVAAWIDFPGQAISYPIVQGEDNEHYLKYTFEGKRNSGGCIFLDSRNTGLMADGNTIIYGHNMRNGSMFGTLKRYMEEDHCRQFPYFDIYTPDKTYRCRIVACARIQAKEENYPVKFGSGLERDQYISHMKALGTYEIPEEASGSRGSQDNQAMRGQTGQGDGDGSREPLVLLSTCTGGQKAYRFVVLARAMEVQGLGK